MCERIIIERLLKRIRQNGEDDCNNNLGREMG